MKFKRTLQGRDLNFDSIPFPTELRIKIDVVFMFLSHGFQDYKKYTTFTKGGSMMKEFAIGEKQNVLLSTLVTVTRFCTKPLHEIR